MGHLRTGYLPKSKKWKDVVSAISSASSFDPGVISDIAQKTLDASNQALRKLPDDVAMMRCFQFLVALAVAGQSSDVEIAASNIGISIEGEPTKLQLSKTLRKWLEDIDAQDYNPEFASLARHATTDTISSWLNELKSKPQTSLFPQSQDPFLPWRTASDGSGFCELSRQFFANFTSRFLNYFLSRTASAQIKTVNERDNFSKAVQDKVDIITKHAFETSKLVQSFSAGWFNKNAIGKLPSDKAVEGFIRHSFEKIREELQREREQS
ncbi:MAG: hypothetical protein HY753_05395 [Nitrospirae bacterium]|nr:hypothetical protein [Nitrospirota bacterium]